MKICPHCGEEVIEDAAEDLINTKDGGVIIDAYLAYVCKAKCGYVQRMEMHPKVIAQQEDDRLLLLHEDGMARVLNMQTSVLWPPMHVDSFLSKGNWSAYNGHFDVEDLINNANDSRLIDKQTPNLFHHATGELSQDAFLCWFIEWGRESNRSIDRPLHEAAREFLSTIFELHGIPVPIFETIEIEGQFNYLDILVIINEKYAILIEDKINTKNHSNQLQRYRDTVKKKYQEFIQLPIYYKTGNQSHYRSVEEAGYIPFTRKMMLPILKSGLKRGVNGSIFIDYARHLQNIEDRYNAYRTKKVNDWDRYAWQGFYQEIQDELNGNWGYVANPSGGFWGFWWNPDHTKAYYLQLEQDKLCVKIVENDLAKQRERRTIAVKEILQKSEQLDLKLEKPPRLGIGRTMTIAQRMDYLQLNEDNTVNVQKTIEELKKYKLVQGVVSGEQRGRYEFEKVVRD